MPVLANKSNVLLKTTRNWVRPEGWLTLPTITSADTKIAGLVAIYENEENAISIQSGAGTSQNYNIDWGDGTSQTGTTTNTYTKRYSYASISSVILQDEFGYNYKQALVVITNNSGTVTLWNLGASITQGGSNNWLDISYSWASDFYFGARYSPFLQQLQIFKATITGNRNQFLELMPTIRFLRWDNVTYSGVTSAAGYLGYLGNIDKIDFTFTPAVTCAQFFQYGRMRALGNLNFSGTTIITNMFFQATVEEIGTINLTATQTATQAFYGCGTLSKLGRLTTPAIVTISSMFANCTKLKEIEFSSCSTITTTSSAFSNCLSLRKLRMPGMAVTFSITGCNMQRQELVDLFNDLATISAKTITITNNPGVADLTAADLLIATNKGWTVTQ